MSVETKEKVFISKAEYFRLKKLDKQFGKLLNYLEDALNVRAARQEIKNKKVISQDNLFRKLGI